MATNQQLCDAARLTVNDPQKVRFPDAEMLGYLNDGMRIIAMRRPDLFFGTWVTETFTYALVDPYPLSERYVPLMQDYLIFRCEAKDDEFSDSGRALKFMQSFYTALG